MRMFEIGQLVPRLRKLRRAALPFIHDLREATKGTVHLAVLDGTDTLYLEILQRADDLPSRIGGRLPAYSTGVGKAMLAYSPASVVQQLVGPAVAKDLLFTGRRVSGLMAHDLGLVNVAVPADELIDHARELAATIAANAPLAVRAVKPVVNHGTAASVEDAFALSDALRQPLNRTEDYAEGLAAFAGRRTPVFRGR